MEERGHPTFCEPKTGSESVWGCWLVYSWFVGLWVFCLFLSGVGGAGVCFCVTHAGLKPQVAGTTDTRR